MKENQTKERTMDRETYLKFLSLAEALAPENLTCDGEATQGWILRRRASLMRQWRRLEKQVGRKVTEDEVWATQR